MLQLQVTQRVGRRARVPSMEGTILDFLDGDTTTVHEIAVNKTLVAAVSPGPLPFQFSDNAHAKVLLLRRGEDGFEQETLYAPSHVSSPAFPGIRTVALQVIDEGFSLDPGTATSGRRITAHVYLEEQS